MGACLLRYFCCCCLHRRKFRQVGQSYEISKMGANDLNGINSTVSVWSEHGKTQVKLNVDNLSSVMEVKPTEQDPQDLPIQEQQAHSAQPPPEVIEEQPVEPSYDLSSLVKSRLDIPYSMSSQPNRYNFLQRTHTLWNYVFPRKLRMRSN